MFVGFGSGLGQTLRVLHIKIHSVSEKCPPLTCLAKPVLIFKSNQSGFLSKKSGFSFQFKKVFMAFHLTTSLLK